MKKKYLTRVPFGIALVLPLCIALAVGDTTRSITRDQPKEDVAPAAGDASQTVLRADFEKPDALAEVGATDQQRMSKLTRNQAEVIGGKTSLMGDSRRSKEEWNEFFHCKTGIFKDGEAYKVTFDYKILASGAKTKFYALLKGSKTPANTGWVILPGDPGQTRKGETAFVARGDDAFFAVGIKNQGAIAIDNLVVQTNPTERPVVVALPEINRTWKSAGRTTYYVDSVLGNDTNNGQSITGAWKTLDKINSGEFASGDKILLKAGSSWGGVLMPGGKGTAETPIVVDSYGDGPKPRIDAAGAYLTTVYLYNSEGFEIRNLDIANTAKKRTPRLTGVLVKVRDYGTARHIVLSGLDIHDVLGSVVKKEGGGAGINFSSGGNVVKSRFDGLLVENCRLTRTDRNGITFGGYWSRQSWFPHLNVVIRGNLLEDIGGDGIVPASCDGALVERNTIRGGRMRATDAAAGIWPWSSDNTVIQFNEVSGMKGTVDGQGFDSDWNCQNTLIQYNYSHNNDGGFLLICNDGTSKMPYNIGNIGTVVRYNISQNDGTRTFHITGPVRDTQIYNNTIFVGPQLDINILKPGRWGGDWPENTRFSNNIFYSLGKSRFDLGSMRNTVFENNAFFGTIENRPADAKAVLADPVLDKVGSAGQGLDAIQGYRLQRTSPAIASGIVIEKNGGRDYAGRKLPTSAPDIGALQTS
jgi:hypothetical protein